MRTLHRIHRRTTPSYHRSQGAIIIVALVMLLIMTLMGVASLDTTSLQSQMARNSLFAQNLYQASRSEIQAQYIKLQGLAYLESVMTSTFTDNNANLFTGITLSDTQAETHDANDAYEQEVTVVFTGDGTPPSGYSLGLFVGKNFQVDSVATVVDTASESDQSQGLNYPAPL